MFVIDGSSSVGNESFNLVKEWIKEVTVFFDLRSRTQVGVVSKFPITPDITPWDYSRNIPIP